MQAARLQVSVTGALHNLYKALGEDYTCAYLQFPQQLLLLAQSRRN
jgi:hypothetical protein